MGIFFFLRELAYVLIKVSICETDCFLVLVFFNLLCALVNPRVSLHMCGCVEKERKGEIKQPLSYSHSAVTEKARFIACFSEGSHPFFNK